MTIEIPITVIDPVTKEDIPMWAIIDGNGVRHVPREITLADKEDE
jgi:hypothetical protein